MSRVDLDELERLDSGLSMTGYRATSAPWSPEDNGWDTEDGTPEYSVFHNGSFVTGSMSIQDAYLITTIRNALPALIAELRAAREVVAAAKDLNSRREKNYYFEWNTLEDRCSEYDRAATKGDG